MKKSLHDLETLSIPASVLGNMYEMFGVDNMLKAQRWNDLLHLSFEEIAQRLENEENA